MKALSLLQPWAALISIGAKSIETRSWQTHYRGMVAIHASARYAPEQRYAAAMVPEIRQALIDANLFNSSFCLGAKPPLGCIVAVATIRDVVLVEAVTSDAFGDFTPGRFAWRLEDVRALLEPIPCKGALSLWDVPADVEAQIPRSLS